MEDAKNSGNALKWSLASLLALLKALLLGLRGIAGFLAQGNRPQNPPPIGITPPPRPQYAGFPFIVGLGQEENDLAYGLGLVALLLFGTWAVKEAVDEKKSLPTRKRRLQVKA
jgi:hypothetical protein